jgi:hypothetical protein
VFSILETLDPDNQEYTHRQSFDHRSADIGRARMTRTISFIVLCKLKSVTVLVEKPQAVTVVRLLVMVDSLAASRAGAEYEDPAGATGRELEYRFFHAEAASTLKWQRPRCRLMGRHGVQVPNAIRVRPSFLRLMHDSYHYKLLLLMNCKSTPLVVAAL